MIKLRLAKWWMYLVPSLRRWLRVCEDRMNSREVQRRIRAKRIEEMRRFMFGKQKPAQDSLDWQLDTATGVEFNPPTIPQQLADEIRECQKEIVDYFGKT